MTLYTDLAKDTLGRQMAFTQMQLILSLGEAMAWFERELNWGVPPTGSCSAVDLSPMVFNELGVD